MERHLDMREIVDLARLPAGDPRRRHLDECQQCRGLAVAQGIFLDPGDTSDLPDLAAADAELADRLDAALADRPVVVARRRRGAWYALAAVLALCAVGLAAGDLFRSGEGDEPLVGTRLRGEAAVGLVATATADSVRWSWSDAPAAETYVFDLLDADLGTVDSYAAPGPTFTAAVADLPGEASFCQAFAVSHGDTLARTPIAALPRAGD